MSRRKGELSAAAIDRGWPHQVALPATECRGSHGRFVDAFCFDLSVCERHHSNDSTLIDAVKQAA
jgi:hypothetical protein